MPHNKTDDSGGIDNPPPIVTCWKNDYFIVFNPLRIVWKIITIIKPLYLQTENITYDASSRSGSIQFTHQNVGWQYIALYLFIIKHTRWNAWRLLKFLVRLIRVYIGDTYNCTIVPVVPAWFRELTCYNGYTGSVLLYVLYTVYCYIFYGQWCTLCSGQWLDDFSHIKRFTHYYRREYICIRYGVCYMYTDLQVVGWLQFII